MSAANAPSDERTEQLWRFYLGLLEPDPDAGDGDGEDFAGLAPGEGNADDDAEELDVEFDFDLEDFDLGDAELEDDGDAQTEPGESDWSAEDHERVQPEWSDTVSDRDDRVTDYDGDAHSESVRSHLRETGTARRIRQALEEIGTESEDVTDEEGAVLDMRNVTRHLAGDTEVRDLYRRRTTRPGDDVAVGVSLDMSGSMGEDELSAKAAVGAFLFAVQQLGGDVVANAWQGQGEVLLLTGPYERFRWEHLDSVSPSGMDPIAIGMYECAAMLRRSRAREKLLVVITDGEPSVRSRDDLGCSSAVAEAEETASELRDEGMTVVGFGFGDVSEENMADMFGDDGYRHVDVEGLADALADCYQEQHERTA